MLRGPFDFLIGSGHVSRVCCVLQEIDIKNQQPNQVFAFVQFDNIRSVVHALHEMDGENLGDCKVKVSASLPPARASHQPKHSVA